MTILLFLVAKTYMKANIITLCLYVHAYVYGEVPINTWGEIRKEKIVIFYHSQTHPSDPGSLTEIGASSSPDPLN